eukprot:CAMPEP_0168513286 /NCGR_PEP_ID=MMETSP0405-20121227/3353_1 /TAXON_ID=498012 /ORGANISM="Trichosphaerium sp, Strain Am-I-7 wt" /LENGTH=487 /DNA_ID=CAMNT_0008532051 /DNA_START=1088 /DNA_END=2551 /DNA_ORIENTATION=-
MSSSSSGVTSQFVFVSRTLGEGNVQEKTQVFSRDDDLLTNPQRGISYIPNIDSFSVVSGGALFIIGNRLNSSDPRELWYVNNVQQVKINSDGSSVTNYVVKENTLVFVVAERNAESSQILTVDLTNPSKLIFLLDGQSTAKQNVVATRNYFYVLNMGFESQRFWLARWEDPMFFNTCSGLTSEDIYLKSIDYETDTMVVVTDVRSSSSVWLISGEKCKFLRSFGDKIDFVSINVHQGQTRAAFGTSSFLLEVSEEGEPSLLFVAGSNENIQQLHAFKGDWLVATKSTTDDVVTLRAIGEEGPKAIIPEAFGVTVQISNDKNFLAVGWRSREHAEILGGYEIDDLCLLKGMDASPIAQFDGAALPVIPRFQSSLLYASLGESVGSFPSVVSTSVIVGFDVTNITCDEVPSTLAPTAVPPTSVPPTISPTTLAPSTVPPTLQPSTLPPTTIATPSVASSGLQLDAACITIEMGQCQYVFLLLCLWVVIG